jgi:hypothetical protein
MRGSFEAGLAVSNYYWLKIQRYRWYNAFMSIFLFAIHHAVDPPSTRKSDPVT